jgi:hypothetical protein
MKRSTLYKQDIQVRTEQPAGLRQQQALEETSGLTQAEADARYYTKAEIDAMMAP